MSVRGIEVGNSFNGNCILANISTEYLKVAFNEYLLLKCDIMCSLLKFDCSRRFGCDIVETSVDTADFVDYPSSYFLQPIKIEFINLGSLATQKETNLHQQS